MCQQSNETQDHLFYTCQKAKEIWWETLTDWNIQLQTEGIDNCIVSLKKQTGPRQIRELHTAITNAVIDHIRQAQNILIFQGKTQDTKIIVKAIREQIT